MKVHEYQARDLLHDAGLPVPAGKVCDTPDDVRAAAADLFHNGHNLVVVKAQVFTGGRGKAGGVKLVYSSTEAYEAAKAMTAKPLVTHQTGPDGVEVKKMLVVAGVLIEKEYYLAITLDRTLGAPVLIASSEGGVEIEETAKTNPDALIRHPLHPLLPLQPYECRKVAFQLGFHGEDAKIVSRILSGMTKVFLEKDADLVEINPLVVTKAGEILAIDAKMTFDENAMYRQPRLKAMFDPSETPKSELDAKKFGLSYVDMDGNIGCLVNGAGLAMATMDIIKLHGGEPANFLDVGGGASEEAVTEAFKIILADPKVEGVLVNIFGGIMQCDKIARAIVSSAEKVGFKVPLVVRLEGTNVEPARKIIEEAKKTIPVMQVATDLTDAAEKVTSAVKAA